MEAQKVKKHIFNAGPAKLPQAVLEEAAKGVLELDGTGESILEISHRSKYFAEIIEEAKYLVKKLLNTGDDYEVLFLQGGASMQFCMVPYNLLGDQEKAGYVETGTWAKKAIAEARNFGEVKVLASSEDANYNYIPKGFEIDNDLQYLHITTNNTIFGTQYHTYPESPVPVVADMSSDIFSRPVDINRFALIYAGAQKNLGPAGATLVVIRKELAGRNKRQIPTMLDYTTHIKNSSLFNTPPVFAIYVSYLNLKHLDAMGGLEVIGEINRKKARMLYDEIDRNSLFKGTAAREDRSWMNATFVLENPALEDAFLKMAAEADITGIKGHRSVGGFRASLYNAVEPESVEVLVEVMKRFEEKYG